MYRHNGGYKGIKRTQSQGGFFNAAKGRIRGRSNGGFMGVEMRSADLQQNINKLSGIWPLHGTRFVVNGASITTTETVDNSYYRQDPPYQAFQQTGSTTLGGGYKWNVSMDLAACGTVTWPQGSMGGHTGSNLQRSWTKVGTQGCDGWTFDVIQVSGYYYTVYPDPVYVEQFDEVTTTTEYNVWDWFG
tara:strand:- start:178 stop:741 length:564 start_codon:yes stop_codon:yes gene_type:complete